MNNLALQKKIHSFLGTFQISRFREMKTKSRPITILVLFQEYNSPLYTVGMVYYLKWSSYRVVFHASKCVFVCRRGHRSKQCLYVSKKGKKNKVKNMLHIGLQCSLFFSHIMFYYHHQLRTCKMSCVQGLTFLITALILNKNISVAFQLCES